MSDDLSEASPEALRDESPTLTLAQRKGGATPPTPDVRLYHRAVVAPMEPPLRWVPGPGRRLLLACMLSCSQTQHSSYAQA
jgi:hypothetical protein